MAKNNKQFFTVVSSSSICAPWSFLSILSTLKVDTSGRAINVKLRAMNSYVYSTRVTDERLMREQIVSHMFM